MCTVVPGGVYQIPHHTFIFRRLLFGDYFTMEETEGLVSAPSLSHITSLPLPEGQPTPGFCLNNHVIYGNTDSKTVIKCHFDGNNYTQVWEKPMPEQMKYNSGKFITPDAGLIVLFDLSNKTTKIFSGDLELLQSTHKSRDGWVRAVGTNKIIYKRGNNDLEVHNLEHKVLHTLSPPPERDWGALTAVCVTPDGAIVVVCKRHRLLHIYSPEGKLQHTSSLPYIPDIYCVTASRQHIFVADADQTKLHVHAHDTACHLNKLSLQQLQLDGEDRIRFVGYGEERYLHVYTAKGNTNTNGGIHAYKID